MTDSTEQVAAKLRAGWAQGPLNGIRILGSLAADKITTTHVPPVPADGTKDGAAWAAGMQQLYEETLQHTISGFKQEVICRVDGDVIRSENVFKGTLKDGTPLNHCVDGVMTVKNGRIVNAVTIYNDERLSWPALVKAMNRD
ncbi:MAG TPA: hypothetical protein VN154_02855 [Rhizomicrobium sp.]|nr:hypothetical protein [Rhizomicrobium sp.]